MIAYAVTISLYLLGLLFFYTMGVADEYYSAATYYIWDKLKDILLLVCIAIAPRNPPGLKLVIGFAVIRLLWEIICIITGWNINNTKAVGILFILLIIVIFCLMYNDLIKWRKQNLRRSS